MKRIINFLLSVVLCLGIITINVSNVHAVSGFEAYFSKDKSFQNYFTVGDHQVTFHMSKSMISKLDVGDTLYTGFVNNGGAKNPEENHFDYWHYTIDEEDLEILKKKNTFTIEVTQDFITKINDLKYWASSSSPKLETLYLYSKDVYDKANINYSIYNYNTGSYMSNQTYSIFQTPYDIYDDGYYFDFEGNTLRLREYSPRPKVTMNVGEEFLIFLRDKKSGTSDLYFIGYHQLKQSDIEAMHTATGVVTIEVSDEVKAIINSIPEEKWYQRETKQGLYLDFANGHSFWFWSKPKLGNYSYLGTILDFNEKYNYVDLNAKEEVEVETKDESKEEVKEEVEEQPEEKVEEKEEEPKDEEKNEIEEKPAMDLSSYANNQLNVYTGSRVTKINKNGSVLSVDGYMFKGGANCNSKNAIYREIIFVNQEDSDVTKAYRQEVTPVYNTWLNKNMTATENGKYDLSYANYNVAVDTNKVMNYKKTSTGKMTSGTYLVYMRISDGKNAYLFPLVDRTLSDGSNLENTGKLVNGLSLVDSESRVICLEVK